MSKVIWHPQAQSQLNLENLNDRGKETMVEWLGIKITEIGDDYMTATMPVDHRTRQVFGIMHGGASCVLAETVGSIAANYVIDPNLQRSVGLTIDTSHIRSIKEGLVIGTAKPLHLGRTTQVWNIGIKDEQGRVISETRLTMAVLDN